jgi:hypothetical protein
MSMNLKITLLLALVLMHGIANAESYLCITHAAAGVTVDNKHPESTSLRHPNSIGYILTDENGVRVLKTADSHELLITCQQEFYCKENIPFGKEFMLKKDNRFLLLNRSLSGYSEENIRPTIALFTGDCSRI